MFKSGDKVICKIPEDMRIYASDLDKEYDNKKGEIVRMLPAYNVCGFCVYIVKFENNEVLGVGENYLILEHRKKRYEI